MSSEKHIIKKRFFAILLSVLFVISGIYIFITIGIRINPLPTNLHMGSTMNMEDMPSNIYMGGSRSGTTDIRSLHLGKTTVPEKDYTIIAKVVKRSVCLMSGRIME